MALADFYGDLSIRARLCRCWNYVLDSNRVWAVTLNQANTNKGVGHGGKRQ
jgi:hypothetical protein